MAEEKLTLIDGMSAPLRRIVQEAQRAAKMLDEIRKRLYFRNTQLDMQTRSALFFKRQLDRARSSADKLRNSLNNLKMPSFNIGFGAIFDKISKIPRLLFNAVNGVKISLDMMRTVTKPVDRYRQNLTRTALVNDGSMTNTQRMRSLYQSALDTRAPLDATMMLYNRIALSGVKASNDRIQKFVERFNKVTAISGTTTQENRAVMLQLAQGMGSNRLGGDEFRSISEQAPLFKAMLAKGLGVNPGALKEMGAQGKLTAEVIMQAFEKTGEEIDNIFKNAPWTISQAMSNITTSIDMSLVDQQQGYSAVLQLLKDINTELLKPEVQEFIKQLAEDANNIVIKITEIIRHLKPVFDFIMNHYEIFKQVVKFLFWNMIPLGIARLGGGIVSTTKKVHKLTGAFRGVERAIIGCGLALSRGYWPMLLGLLGGKGIGTAMVNAINSISDIRLYHHGTDWLKGWEATNEGGTRGQTQDISKDYVATRDTYDKFVDRWNAHPEKHKGQKLPTYEEYIKNAQALNSANPQSFIPERNSEWDDLALTGSQNSMNNKTMPVETKSKGGYLDGIRDDLSIDNDSIEMMKMIAERQWIMQNEVTVPQNVTVTVDRSVTNDPQEIVAQLAEGAQLFTASSMRSSLA